jgi:DNA anti-recombination protein RmuC
MLTEIIITKEIIGISTLALSLIGVVIRLNSRIEKLEYMTKTHAEMIKEDREVVRRMLEKLTGDFIHLEKNIGQMQTNLRIFIGEQGKETAEQLNKLSDKIEHLKDEHNKYKIEITERFNSNHTHR